MKVYQMVGRRQYDFTGKDGKRIQGAKFFFTAEDEYVVEGMEGREVEELSVSVTNPVYSKLMREQIDTIWRIYWSKTGKVEDVVQMED